MISQKSIFNVFFSFILVLTAVNASEAEFSVDRYNVVWDTPSKDSSGSMPLGNGDIGLNVWVEEKGDLYFYISKTDAWSENARLLKLGRVGVHLSPNPFAEGPVFQQILSLSDGTINITAGEPAKTVSIQLWVDAHHPVIHFDAKGKIPFEIQVALETWRTESRELEREQEIHSAYGLAKAPFPVIVTPDTILEERPNQIVWFHRNDDSIWPLTLKHQGLSDFIDHSNDPLTHRTFGGAIEGNGLVGESPTSLRSKERKKSHRFSIHILTAQTETEKQWVNQLDKLIEQNNKISFTDARKKHFSWWDEFWNRSWIHVFGGTEKQSVAEPTETYRVSQGYALQRFISACAGRGDYPIKFNGSIFTVDAREPNQQFDADYRRWGGPYWFQNTRLVYWPMPASGDFEMMRPLFDMFYDALLFAKFRTESYFDHKGAYFPETMYFWGAYALDNYGWKREGLFKSEVVNRYIRYYWSNNLELLTLMLELYDYTHDNDFLKSQLIPLANEIMLFFDRHFPRDDEGKLHIKPAQALETWQKAVNPITVIAGVKHVLPRLLSLPEQVTETGQQELWQKLLNDIPSLPKAKEEGETFLLPAEKFDELRNSENPELYPIFPYRLYGVGKPNLEVARLTFEKRRIKRTGGWSQDSIQAAYLGLTETARDYTVQNFTTKHEGSRFPAFWGPNFDWIPDQDHGNVAMIALQSMLMQCHDESILLFPAWPKQWNVEFKLHAPHKTIIEGRYENGTIHSLEVQPQSRKSDVQIIGEMSNN